MAATMLALTATSASAQQESLRDQILGTWNFVVAKVVAPDGKKSFPFGETPSGILIFTANGRFAQIGARSARQHESERRRWTGPRE